MKNQHILPGDRANLLRMYNSATPEQVAEGRDWYQTAQQIACEVGRTNLARGAGIIAALSPQCDWPRNISDAWQIVERDTISFQSGFNAERARRIRDASVPSVTAEDEFISRRCRKVMAFYQSIVNPEHAQTDWVCIDTHAVNAYVGRKTGDIEKKQLDNVDVRERIQQAYAQAAGITGETLTAFQAIIWAVARGMSAQAWYDFKQGTDYWAQNVINK